MTKDNSDNVCAKCGIERLEHGDRFQKHPDACEKFIPKDNTQVSSNNGGVYPSPEDTELDINSQPKYSGSDNKQNTKSLIEEDLTISGSDDNHRFYCCDCNGFFKEPHNHASDDIPLYDKRQIQLIRTINKERWIYPEKDVKEAVQKLNKTIKWLEDEWEISEGNYELYDYWVEFKKRIKDELGKGLTE